MARGIQIPITLDIGKFVSGIKTVETDVEQLADAFEKVEQASDDINFDGLSQELKGEAQQAEQAVEGLEQSFDELGPAARQAGNEAGAGLSQGIRGRINDTALGVVGAEVASEFTQSFGEAVRAGNPAEAIYETLTNAAVVVGAALPGAGTVIGMGVAAITGMVQGIRQEEQRLREAVRGSINDAFDGQVEEAIEDGTAIGEALVGAILTPLQKLSALQSAFGVDTLTEGVVKASQAADLLGVSFDTVVEAIGGTGQAQEEANQKIDAAAQKAADVNAEYENGVNPIETIQGLVDGTASRLQDAENAGRELSAAAAENAKSQADAAQSAGDLALYMDGVARETYLAAGGGAQLASDFRVAADQAQRIRNVLATLPRTIPVQVVVTEVRRDSARASLASSGIQN